VQKTITDSSETYWAGFVKPWINWRLQK